MIIQEGYEYDLCHMNNTLFSFDYPCVASKCIYSRHPLITEMGTGGDGGGYPHREL